MARKKEQEKDLLEDLEADVETAVEDAETVEAEAPATEKREWVLLDGTPCPRTQFIKEQFVSLNKTKKEISEEFEILYRNVYAATINLTNEAEAASGGGNRARSFIDVDGEKIARNDYIKQLAEAGMNRAAILAKLHEVTGDETIKYQVVYNATKDIEGMGGTRGAKIMVTLEDGTELPRVEYIKKRHDDGLTVSDIAKELEVSYQTVYSVIGSKTKARVTIKASSVEELDQMYAEERARLVKEDEEAAEGAAE